MKQLPTSVARPLIRTAYLLPLLLAIALLTVACIPHIFFVYNNIPTKETHNLFALMANTWKECSAMLEGSAKGSTNALYFSYVMNFCVIFSWVCILLFATVALACAICSTRAFAYPPTSREANRAKRWMQLFCPNRPLFAVACLLPLVPSAFPAILALCYRKLLNYEMEVAFIGVNDLILASVGVVLCLALFFSLLPAQAREHMDLYRLYKAKK